jgi:hypothetical protein
MDSRNLLDEFNNESVWAIRNYELFFEKYFYNLFLESRSNIIDINISHNSFVKNINKLRTKSTNDI